MTRQGVQRGPLRRVNRVVCCAVVLFVSATLLAGAEAPLLRVSRWTPPAELSGSEVEAAHDVATLRTVEDWEALFLRSYDSDRIRDLEWSSSGQSWSHYSLAYSIDSLTAMYRATGDPHYLNEVFELVENMMASARPSAAVPGSQYGDHYLGWPSGRLGAPGEVPLFESYAWRYVTTLLRVVEESPVALEDARTRERYDRILGFAEKHVFDKWAHRGADSSIYRTRAHMAAHWALMAINLAAVTSDPARREAYRRVARNVDTDMPNNLSSLRGQLVRTTAPDAYVWSDVWGSMRQPAQDVDHANGVIAYLVEAAAVGEEWKDRDMARLVTTLDQVIWPAGGTPSMYVDGSGVGTGWFSDGFVKLGRFDAALQRRLEQHQPANGQFYANGALNAQLLGVPSRLVDLNAAGRPIGGEEVVGRVPVASERPL